MTLSEKFRRVVQKMLFMRELPTLERYPVIHSHARGAIRRLDRDRQHMDRLNRELFELEQSLPAPEESDDESDGTGPGNHA